MPTDKKKGGSKKKGSASSPSTKPDVDRFLNDSALKKLAYRAGCKRMGAGMYNAIREYAKDELDYIIAESMNLADVNATDGKPKTLKSEHIVSTIESLRGIRLAYSEGLKNDLSRI